jgi:hypothetical protein
MRNPEQCRDQAQQYREQASTAKTVLERVRYEELALTWQRLATNLERAMTLLDHSEPEKKN